ncbi:MAG: hypothetical protein OIF47_00430 [Marinibacterium sp.]|nr:hypothetical protein [Marinibacterium sp.]
MTVERELGEITAHLKNLNAKMDAQGEKIDRMDTRLRAVETKSAISGAVAGGVVGVGLALVKDYMTRGGS